MALTTAETANIKSFVLAGGYIDTVGNRLGQALGIGSTSPEMKAAMKVALDHYAIVRHNHARGLAYFLRTTIDQDQNPFPNPDDFTVAAYGHRDQVLFYLDILVTDIQALQAFNTENSTYQGHLSTCLTMINSFALPAINGMDTNLTYSDPYPRLATPEDPNGVLIINGIRTAVGPHGDYFKAQRSVNRTKIYVNAYWGNAATLYANGATPSQVAGAFTSAAGYWTNADRSTALNANVPIVASETAETDRFCRIIRVSKIQTVPMAGWLKAMVAVIGTLTLSSAGANLQTLKALSDNMADAWSTIDQATWMLLIFPGSTRCPDPFLAT